MRMTERNQAVALAYRDTLKSMREIALEFDLSEGRVSEIIKTYEKAAGVKFSRTLKERVLEMYPQPIPRVFIQHAAANGLTFSKKPKWRPPATT